MASVSDCSFIKSASGSEQNYSLSSATVIFKQLGLHNLFNSVHVQLCSSVGEFVLIGEHLHVYFDCVKC